MKANKILTDDEILGECRYQSSNASGSEYVADELISDRTNALKYYLGRARGDEIEGRSSAISMDVADMIDSMLAQIMPTFTQDQIVQFEATSEEDEEQARIESNFCNYLVMEKNNGYILLETAIKDALLSKNATIKVIVDVKIDTEHKTFKDLSEDEFAAIALELQLTKEQNEEDDYKVFDKKEGTISVTRTTTKRKLLVLPVAPENFSVISSHQSPYLDDCVYCVERSWPSKSDLVEQGYDPKIVADLPPNTTDTKVDSIERNQIQDEQNYQNNQDSMQNVMLEEHYIRIDRDGDGISELLKVCSVKNKLLYWKDGKPSIEEVECVPFANGVAVLMGHRFYGLSIYDKLRHVEDSKTHFLRQWHDNALISNHNKEDVVEDKVNMDDFTNGRPNAIRRVEDLNSNRTVPTNDIGPSCKLALDYQDKIRTDRTGSSLDLQANQMTMPSNIGDQGVNTLIANLEMVTALFTRNLSETLIKSTFMLVHKFMRLYFPEELSVKMAGKWETTNPSQWLERDQVNITIPPTRSEKIAQQVALEKVLLHSSSELAQGKGGITTDEGQIYQLKLDHMRLSGIDHPEKYLINPESEEAQQIAQQQAQQQQIMQMQAQEKQDQLNNQLIQAQVLEIRRNWESDIADREQKTVQFMEDLEFKYTELFRKLEMNKYDTDVDADIKEAGIVGNATTQLELANIKGNGQDEAANI